ncbi:golgin subfamily A member 6-like protein 6 isoform X2 [Silurus meridionalis]|uniref:golgin subfamily A member 6-like protein 6 isoform X2 n=1 Tax=Silurus meridionalis TaxID=175797 RepID=UPI001EEC5D13|nr:golgin subfamily A member 6-like protein 6 isoform X2 [Silurus meridionalis]
MPFILSNFPSLGLKMKDFSLRHLLCAGVAAVTAAIFYRYIKRRRAAEKKAKPTEPKHEVSETQTVCTVPEKIIPDVENNQEISSLKGTESSDLEDIEITDSPHLENTESTSQENTESSDLDDIEIIEIPHLENTESTSQENTESSDLDDIEIIEISHLENTESPDLDDIEIIEIPHLENTESFYLDDTEIIESPHLENTESSDLDDTEIIESPHLENSESIDVQFILSLDDIESYNLDIDGSNLEDRVRELEDKLCKAYQVLEKTIKDKEEECNSHRLLKAQCSKMEEEHQELLKECERQQEAHTAQNLQYQMTLRDTEESQKVAQAEAEKKFEQIMESNVQLENENSDLKTNIDKLEGRVWQLEELLCDAEKMYNSINQDYEQMRKAYSNLKSQHEEVLIQHDEALKEREQERDTCSILLTQSNHLKATLYETVEKYETQKELNGELRDKNSELQDEVNKLQSSVRWLNEELCKAQENFETITKKREEEQEVYRMLQSQNDEFKKLLNHNEQLLQDTLAEAENKLKQKVESDTQLETKESDLEGLEPVETSEDMTSAGSQKSSGMGWLFGFRF